MINRTYQGKPILVIVFLSGFQAYLKNDIKLARAYHDLFKIVSQTFSVFVVKESQYQASGVFSDGAYYNGKKLIAYPTRIPAKVVFYRGYHLRGGQDWVVLNNARLNYLLKNKYLAYQKFKPFFKPTFWFKNRVQLQQALKQIKTETVVYKPQSGSAGKQVMIARKQLLIPLLKQVKAGLLQDFIDTSGGIPGICQGTHDLRLVIMNGKICEAYIRFPKARKLIANWSLGGSLQELALKKVPLSAQAIVQKVDDQLKIFGPRLYSVDLGFEQGKPYIIELNRRPGIPYLDIQPLHYWHWYQELLIILQSALKTVS